MPFHVDMEIVTVRARDGVEQQKHIVRGQTLALIQERRDDGDRVTAYVDTGERDDMGRRVLHEPPARAAALRR